MGISFRQAYSWVLVALTLILLGSCGEVFDADNTITIHGQISDPLNQPIESALVEITNPPELQQSTQTDSTGSYIFSLESDQTTSISVKASKPNFTPQIRTFNAEPGTNLNNINIELLADTTGNGDGGNDGSEGEDGPGAASIMLSNTPPQAINIAQTGESISATFTFQVQDSVGNALNTQKSVEVKFKLLSSPGGEEKLVPEKATTNSQGQVSTTLYSGNKAGEVKLQAVIEEYELGFVMKSSPTLIAIHGGYPDLNHFSLSGDQKNIEGFDINDLTVPISVILGDEFSNPVKPGTIVYFETTGGVIQGSGSTDESGRTGVELTSANPRPTNGRATITASTVDKNDIRIQKNIDVIFSSSEATISSATTSFDLQPGKSKTINYTVTDINNNPMAPGTKISVEASDSLILNGDTNITLQDYLKEGPDKTKFSFSIENALQGTDDLNNTQITINVTSPSGVSTVFDTISGILRGNPEPLPPPEAAAIELTAQPSPNINIAATGDGVSTSLTFEVQDAAGNPLNIKRAIEVQFNLTKSPGGNEQLLPAKATTNENGQVTTKLISGNKAGVVQIQAIAQVSGSTIKSEPVSVVIHGGFPDLDHFDISASPQNINTNSDALPTINITLGDQFSNPVKPGTAISFKTSSGIIQGSANTNADGEAAVRFTSLNPRNNNGNVTVTASTVGNNNQSVSKDINLIFSTPNANISASPTSFEIRSSNSQKINYTATDDDGNPMAKGTQISITGDEGIMLSGDTDITLSDYLNAGADKTAFDFTINDTGTSNKESINITITVTSPSGTVTTYKGISGKRIIEGSDQVGAAAIVLTQQPLGAININETGDEVSAPLTFQVRDSLGRPLTQENAVEVQFSIVSSPGGGEDLIPAKATTDGQGNVTTTLFSGNKAGEVKVQALVQRADVGLTIKSSPILVAIHGGFPDEDHFSASIAKQNFEGYTINNNRNTISVILGDKFSNPVKPGTVVYFETTGGVIQGSGQTDQDGLVQVDLISGDPRPPASDGLATVTASTVNENNVRIQKQLDVVFSTSKAIINSNPTTFNLPPNGGASFDYTVTDLNGNPMAAGTQINISAGEGIEITGDANFTLGNYLNPGPGATEFSFSIRDTDDKSDDPADLTLQIEVIAPSGESTTYSGIQGVRSETH